MGNKIITEKDFWMCTSGAMPSQLQGTRKSTKKQSGEVYITVDDTATSSWIDFGCTKSMWLDALIAAVVVVVAVVVISAIVVATGGAALVGIGALIAIGAGAGVAGAIYGAVEGAMKCGQKLATKRKWSDSKTNFISQKSNTITGGHTMICAIGGVVTFAPKIKSWSGAIGMATLDYGTKLVEAAFTGAGVGLGGGLLASGFTAMTGLGALTESVAIVAPTTSSVLTNVGLMAGLKTLSGGDNLARENAMGKINSTDDALKAGIPEYEAAQRIYSGGPVTMNDALLFGSDILLPFLNVKIKPTTPTVSEPAPALKTEPNEVVEPVAQPETTVKSNEPASGKTGDAYEANPTKKYDTTEMSSHYKGEESGNGWCAPKKVQYLSAAERAELKLTIREGKVYDSKGNLYDTTDAGTFFSGKGKSIFVMDSNGNIYASKHQAVGEFHHSSILRGEPVSGAGEITVKDGVITEISNRSGHYQPTQEINSQVLKQVGSEGVDISNINIGGY
jgi:hypothetical protein